MAEYIDKEKALSTLENTAKYYEMPNADEWTKGIHYGLLHGVDNIVDNVPTEDVVEREKIDKAIEEIANYRDFHKDKAAKDTPLEQGYYLGYCKCLEILKRNIEE